jgi:hypothetical protein
MATQTTPRRECQADEAQVPPDDAAEESKRLELQQAELRRREELAQREATKVSQEISEQSEGGSSSEEESTCKDFAAWDISGNPDRRFLEGEDYCVSFPSDAKTNFVNVLTREPLKRGVHFFEFTMHRIGDEQWCGLTEESFQAGALVSGRNLSAWSYYCGRRQPKRPQDFAALHANKRSQQKFAHVSSGDVISLLVDASQRVAVFLRNGELQGVCRLPRSQQPLYVFTHLDASGDAVSLKQIPLEQAPQLAIDVLRGAYETASPGEVLL